MITIAMKEIDNMVFDITLKDLTFVFLVVELN